MVFGIIRVLCIFYTNAFSLINNRMSITLWKVFNRIYSTDIKFHQNANEITTLIHAVSGIFGNSNHPKTRKSALNKIICDQIFFKKTCHQLFSEIILLLF